MITLRQTVLFTVAAAFAGGFAAAGEIYKWIDEEGNVHYEDRPLGGIGTQRLDIDSRDTDAAAVQARLDAVREARAVADQVNAEATPEMTAEEIRQEREERAEKCQTYRDRLEAFLRSQRLYREDDSGERQYLSEDEILAARSRVEGQIKQYCGA